MPDQHQQFLCPAHEEFSKRVDHRWTEFTHQQQEINREAFERIGYLEKRQSENTGAISALKFIITILSVLLGGGFLAELLRLSLRYEGVMK